MIQPMKKQKVEGDSITHKEEVLFNSDTLSKVISYLPSVDVLNLALSCKRLGSATTNDEQSLIEDCTRIAIHEIATEEELATLSYYNGENSLVDYHYLESMRGPLNFDQLVGTVYVNSGDKTCVTNSGYAHFETAFSNNIMRAGKHYVTFETYRPSSQLLSILVGVMRPGKAKHSASGIPLAKEFYQHFSRRLGDGEYNNSNVQCCLYNSSIFNCQCYSSKWDGGLDSGGNETWVGMERVSTGDEIGMLLDLDEGSLSVYKNGRKLGVMQRGLAGPYCWVVSIYTGGRVGIKRGTVPPS